MLVLPDEVEQDARTLKAASADEELLEILLWTPLPWCRGFAPCRCPLPSCGAACPMRTAPPAAAQLSRGRPPAAARIEKSIVTVYPVLAMGASPAGPEGVRERPD